MPNLTAVIGANTSKFVEEIKSAKYMLEKFVDETKNAKDSVEDNVSVTNEQVNAYKKVVKTLEQVASGTMNTKQQQAALSSSVKELKIQWANLSNTAKSGEFGKMLSSTLVESQSALGQLTTQVKQAEAELGNFGGGNVKRQLADLTRNLTNLTAQYRTLTEAEKQSAAGQELAQKMEALRTKSAQLKDTVSDVQAEIKVLASDTPNLDAFNSLIGISADALSTYSSVIAKVTGEDKALKNAISTVMAVQSAANFMTKLATQLQSSSILMVRVRVIQEKAAAMAIKTKTAAEGKSIIVTKAATVAQTIFNAVAKANPYVLLAMAIIGVGAALVGFISSTNDATEAEKANAEAAQAQADAYNDELKSSLEETIPRYIKLQEEWKNLRSEGEKIQWIKDNKEEFNKLGIEVNNVNDAENVLETNSKAVMDAFMQRAKAAALSAKAMEIYKQSLEDIIWLEAQRGSTSVKSDELQAHGSSTKESNARLDHHGGMLGTGHGRYEIDVDKAIEQRRAKAEEQVRNLYQEMAKEEEKGEQILSNAGVKTIEKTTDKTNKALNKGSSSNKKVIHDNSLEEAEELVKTWENALKQADVNNTELIKRINEKLAEAKAEVEKRKIILGIGVAKGSISSLESELSDLKKKYKDGLLPELSAEDYLKKVQDLEKQIQDKNIEMGLAPKPGSIEYISKQISAKEAELKLAIDPESRQKIQKEIDELTGQKHDIEITLKPVVQEKDIKELEDEIDEHQITVQANVNAQITSGQPQSKSDKAQSNADNLKEELDFSKQIVKSYQEQYNLIKERQQLGVQLTSNEQKLVSIYEDAKDRVDALSESYKEAAKNANELRLNSEIKKKTWQGVKSGISTLGDLNGAVMNIGGTWQNLAEQWEDMSPFEQVTSAFDATISTIENVIGAYEAINDMIKLFGEISELSAAKKMAANSSEMASDQAKMAMETANTQTKLANDTAENTSEMGKLGVKEAGAIASATSSGASLPFPANIAAIAAGIAAVVAAFAMVFSCFADGGIVGNGSKIGDYNIARVNGGEMILNGTQQKRLFNLLNTDGGFTSGRIRKQDVNFVIKGKALRGTLRNYDGMKKKI